MKDLKLQGIDKNGETKEFTLADFGGKRIVLYFYPKDDTPICTKEAKSFRDNLEKLSKYGVVIGVSSDDIDSHKSFKEKYHLNFPLLSDIGHKLAEKFKVLKDKIQDGKKIYEVERSTFIIDENGNIEKEWRNIDINGHIEEILEYLKK